MLIGNRNNYKEINEIRPIMYLLVDGNPPPPNAEVKNAWSYISTPQYTFMPW
jgi:hypothetical protein